MPDIEQPVDGFARAKELLRAGMVVALPTDTVYGLGARADLADAADTIFLLKGRPDSVALPVLVGNVGQARALVASETRDSAAFEALARAYWPGPLTIVVRRHRDCHFRLGGDSSTIGLRLPADRLVQQLAAEVGPLAVTSANLHQGSPCTSAAQVRAIFGDAVYVLDGGVRGGTPSSVVSLLDDALVVLREGAISTAELERVVALS